MYELSRVRLYSIGPAGARYADTVLDLRSVGAPVPRPAPAQAEFFEDEPTGPPRRPAPAGVLFLENGGGKSVLLKLIFSVMLPGHRNTLGGASSGVLRKFLLAEDCGHVALEWQHTLTGELVVVGKASEWRGRQVSSDPRKFAESWYSFRPGPGMSLDSLPVAESTRVPAPADGVSGARGRRRTMKGFRDALTEAGKVYPHLEVHWEEIHERWTEHLGDLGLDPELFRYQREMNADEGEAAGLFAVKKDSDFTDLLLRAVTDTRDTDGFADLVSGFAQKLGRRDELIAERDFTAGSVELLTAITEAGSTRARIRDVHSGAELRTRALSRRLHARAEQERLRTAEVAAQLTTAAEGAGAAEEKRSARALVAAELAFRHASLALASAEKDAAARKRELGDARTQFSAWQAAETLLRHRAAADRAARVGAAIREAERDAAPALAARGRAAAALVRALHTAARRSEDSAAEHEKRCRKLQATGESAHREATVAATEAQRARSEREHLKERLQEVEQETERALEAGWLDDLAPDNDPARAALAASDTEKAAVAAWDVARGAAQSAGEEASAASAAESRAELAAARAADAEDSARAAYTAPLRAAEALAAEPRAAELLGAPGEHGPAVQPGQPAVPGPRDAEPVTVTEGAGDAARPVAEADAAALDHFAAALEELLAEGVAGQERRLFSLRTEAADDARILGALGDGGLLPAGPDVLATVEYLGEHGIPALPGWRYLAQSVDPADHQRVLAAHPELVDGVVITGPAGHARAREVLADAALLPRSAVAVGTSEALLAPATEETARDVFLVAPNPAMHDEAAADEERRTLRARAAGRDDEIRALAARLAGDRELAGRLTSWRTACPEGRLEELRAEARAAEEHATATRAALEEARSERVRTEEAAREALRVREERQEAAQRARRAADALAGLAHRLRERAAWQIRVRELADEAAESGARAEELVLQARGADEDRRGAQRAADDARRTAHALRAERAEIAGAPEGKPDGAEDPTDGPAPSTSLAELREAYRTASQVYEKAGVDADLRAEQARAEGDEAASLAELERLTNKVRNRAQQLLESPDGADGPSRLAAAARAEELVQLLETRSSTASEQLGRLRGEAERHAPAEGDHHTELPEEMVPSGPRQAQTLLRAAGGELAVATDALEEARATHDRLLSTHRASQEAAGSFEETAALLRDLLRDPRDHREAAESEGAPAAERDPFPGSPEEARQAAAEARRSLRGCAADLAAADSSVREACDVLVRHANSTRYEQVRTPARQQIRELPAAALPEHAARWAEAFAPRLRVLTDELEQLERNRDSIVDRLRGLVESSLATLRAAQRLSRLPDGLGEWSGQEFLRIRFAEPDQATLTERLGEVVDDATRAAVRKNSDLRRDGMSLLLRGVEAALEPGGVSVEILKPDAVLRAERVPVGQMGDVFSGGQLLTAAIALYCTMAALRSNDRGRDKHRHAGTLFLDNPIGRANATYLLELQRAVADALGVQLLYTTGLFDTTALAEFPLVIRLRNDADLRAGLKYIRVEEHLRPGLPRPAEDEGTHGQITATRMYRRSPAPELEPAGTGEPGESSTAVPAQGGEPSLPDAVTVGDAVAVGDAEAAKGGAETGAEPERLDPTD